MTDVLARRRPPHVARDFLRLAGVVIIGLAVGALAIVAQPAIARWLAAWNIGRPSAGMLVFPGVAGAIGPQEVFQSLWGGHDAGDRPFVAMTTRSATLQRLLMFGDDLRDPYELRVAEYGMLAGSSVLRDGADVLVAIGRHFPDPGTETLTALVRMRADGNVLLGVIAVQVSTPPRPLVHLWSTRDGEILLRTAAFTFAPPGLGGLRTTEELARLRLTSAGGFACEAMIGGGALRLWLPEQPISFLREQPIDGIIERLQQSAPAACSP